VNTHDHGSDVDWLQKYMQVYRDAFGDSDPYPQLTEVYKLFRDVRRRSRKVIFAGNGGSAAVASHCAVDFTKGAGVRSINFNEPDLITCFANDFGYEAWLAKALELYADDGDLVVLISSSGRSPNMLRAAEFANRQRMALITLTGFEASNPLRSMGAANLWVNSRAYNVIETTHQVWLLAVCDLIIARGESPARSSEKV
jgi:D-sedoheptulose 7-phosphate isomerase